MRDNDLPVLANISLLQRGLNLAFSHLRGQTKTFVETINDQTWAQITSKVQGNWQVLEAVYANSNTTHFNFYVSSMPSEALRAIVNGLAKNTSVKSLVFSRFAITPDDLLAIAKMVHSHPTLKALDLSCCQIGLWHREGLLQLALGRLERLNLSENTLDDGLLAFAKGLRINRTLVKLELARCQIQAGGFLALSLAMERNRTLQELDLSSNALTMQPLVAADVALICAQFEPFQTREQRAVTAERSKVAAEQHSVAYLTRALLYSPIKKLDLSDTQLTSRYMIQLAKVLAQLETLNLADNPELDDEGIQSLFSKLNEYSPLRSLNLSDNPGINDNAVACIADFLARNLRLTELDLRLNPISYKSARAIGASLPRNRHLSVLKLCGNVGLDGLQALVQAIGDNDSLTLLTIEGKHLPPRTTSSTARRVQTTEAISQADFDVIRSQMARNTRLIEIKFSRLFTITRDEVVTHELSDEQRQALSAITSRNSQLLDIEQSLIALNNALVMGIRNQASSRDMLATEIRGTQYATARFVSDHDTLVGSFDIGHHIKTLRTIKIAIEKLPLREMPVAKLESLQDQYLAVFTTFLLACIDPQDTATYRFSNPLLGSAAGLLLAFEQQGHRYLTAQYEIAYTYFEITMATQDARCARQALRHWQHCYEDEKFRKEHDDFIENAEMMLSLLPELSSLTLSQAMARLAVTREVDPIRTLVDMPIPTLTRAENELFGPIKNIDPISGRPTTGEICEVILRLFERVRPALERRVYHWRRVEVTQRLTTLIASEREQLKNNPERYKNPHKIAAALDHLEIELNNTPTLLGLSLAFNELDECPAFQALIQAQNTPALSAEHRCQTTITALRDLLLPRSTWVAHNDALVATHGQVACVVPTSQALINWTPTYWSTPSSATNSSTISAHSAAATNSSTQFFAAATTEGKRVMDQLGQMLCCLEKGKSIFYENAFREALIVLERRQAAIDPNERNVMLHSIECQSHRNREDAQFVNHSAEEIAIVERESSARSISQM